MLRRFFSLFKRDKNLWVFGAWNGNSFADNTKYLFLHIVENQKDIQCFWITRNREVYDELVALDLPVAHLYSVRGFLACIRAGKQLTTHSLYDISPTLTKGSIHYCLFHATFPLKEMDFGYLKNTLKKRVAIYINKPFAFEKPNYSICSSAATAGIVQSALGLNVDQVIQTGYPRSTFLDTKKYLKTDLLKLAEICSFEKYKNFIYFVPTFRDNQDFDWFGFGFELKSLVELLESTNSVLVFRFHPFELSKIKNHHDIRHDRIIFESHGLSDPYPLLSRASVLVTDYSSIFADFLLLDRPIIFSNFGHQQYINNERALYWDYDKVTPGIKASNWSSLIESLTKTLVNNEDFHKKDRANMSKMIYQQPVDEIFKNVSDLIVK
jgi:CDP-glycerol glycerophosphotransferase (TagB/SpsB family)